MSIFKRHPYAHLEKKAYKALFYDELEEYEAAIEYMLQRVSKKPKSFILHSNLALAYYEIGKIDLAAESIQKATSLKPKNDSVQYLNERIQGKT